MSQRLIKNSKLTNRQLNQLIGYFALEVPASRAAKVPVFGPLKRHGKVYTRIVEDVSRKTLRQIIKTKVVP